MNRTFSRSRRFAVVTCALLVAAAAFKSQLAQALVVRGDEFAYRGQSLRALSHYARAVRLDPQSGIATDRYVFALMQRHSRSALRSAIASASAYLERNSNDDTVLADRALCYLLTRQYSQARRDFERAARISSDPRAYVFAGWAALRAGDRKGARAMWRRALTLNPHFGPARVALAEHAG